MSFSTAALAELFGELERLQKEQLQLSERINALRTLLHIPTPDIHQGFDFTRDLSVEVTERLLPMDTQPATDQKPTVKATVFAALRETPGVKAAVITKALRKRGFKTNGPTRLSHRVYNELWRMWRDGEISKTDDGRFYPPKEGAVG